MIVCIHCGKVLYVPEEEKAKYNFAKDDKEILDGLLEKNYSICTECLQPYNSNKAVIDRRLKEFCLEIVDKYCEDLKKKPNCYYCAHSRHTITSLPTSCMKSDKAVMNPCNCKDYKFSKIYAKDYLRYIIHDKTDIWTKLYLNHVIKQR